MYNILILYSYVYIVVYRLVCVDQDIQFKRRRCSSRDKLDRMTECIRMYMTTKGDQAEKSRGEETNNRIS